MNYRYGSNSASRECLSSAQLQPVSCEQRDEQGPSIALVTGSCDSDLLVAQGQTC